MRQLSSQEMKEVEGGHPHPYTCALAAGYTLAAVSAGNVPGALVGIGVAYFAGCGSDSW